MISPFALLFLNHYLCREWALLHIHTIIQNLPQGSCPVTTIYPAVGWKKQSRGLNALLKDMSDESEEWVSLAFLPPRPFIILIPHSHLFICKHHLHTPSAHPHCTVAGVPPPSPLFPPSLSLPLSPAMLHLTPFPTTHCFHYHSSGMSEFEGGGGGERWNQAVLQSCPLKIFW